MITSLTNVWSDCKVYKVEDVEKYNPMTDEGLTLIRVENKNGKKIWELEELESEVV